MSASKTNEVTPVTPCAGSVARILNSPSQAPPLC